MDKIDSLAALFQQKHPETDWSDCRELLSADDPNTGNYDFAVRHMIRWGKADARIIEDAFQISLPPSVHELYAHIQEAILIWRNIFIFLLQPRWWLGSGKIASGKAGIRMSVLSGWLGLSSVNGLRVILEFEEV